MRSAIIGFVLGAALLQMQAALPSVWDILLLITVALFLALATTLISRGYLKNSVVLASGVAAGFLWASLFAHHHLARELPREWEGRDVTVIGTIDSLPYQFEQGVRFNFAVERVLDSDGAAPVVPPKLSLSWYSGFHGEVGQAVGAVEPGARWQLTVRLQRPHGNANPDIRASNTII
jgi:competence protein ComEC